jgi:hypothetical protein
METNDVLHKEIRFLRYPGRKSKLLSFLVNYLPKGADIKVKYVEPFVGGGPVYMHVKPKKAVIADLNNELIDLYKAIRNCPHKVWEIYCSFPGDKKNGAFRTPDLNYIIAEIARHTGDFAIIKKGLSSFFQAKSLSAEKKGFEPLEVLPSTVFKTAAIDHSATSPAAKLAFFLNHKLNLYA